jgi:DNA-binding HxlR family transcriptional regulator
MRSYGQFGPVAQALEVVGERWTLLVVRELLSGSRRFSEIQRGVPLMSPSLLSQRLTRLERAGIVVQRPGPGGRPEYQVTEAGRELWPVVETLGTWGQRWARREVTPEQLDPSLLMWDIRRRIDFSRVPPRRTVVRFGFRGLTRGHRAWWLILDRGEADLCLSDPGHGVALTVDADLRTLIMVWMGDLPLDRALGSGAVAVSGPRALVRAFPSWLRLNLLAGVERPATAAPAVDPVGS